MAAPKTFERALRFLIPSWLYEGEGGKAFTAITRIVDQNIARGRASLELRFPSRAHDDALQLLGQDRGIFRGRAETSEHYAQRLIEWRYPRGHRVRGNAFAALNQISEYFGGIACWSIDVKGNRHDRAANGDEAFSYGNAWNWDSTLSTKGRFWFVLEPSTPLSYGSDDAAAIRYLFTGPVPWKPGGTMQQWLVINVNGVAAVPDGTWGHWSRNVAGTQTATRYANWRYWALDPALKEYAGNPNNFPTQYNKPGGGTYAGSAALPATITLVGGGTYAGNPNNFPATITLPDDGDPS